MSTWNSWVYSVHFLFSAALSERKLRERGRNVNMILADSIDIFPWWIDINAVQRRKAPTWMEYEQCPFWFPRKIQKGRWIFIEFSENYHMWISRDFWGAEASRIPAFSIFKKGAGCQPPISGRSPVSGRTAFFVFSHNYSVPEKGRRRKWRSKVKNPSCPTYHNPQIIRVIRNAIHWAYSDYRKGNLSLARFRPVLLD